MSRLMSRFRTTLKIILMVVAISLAVISTYLATFDLNHYKEQLADSLGQALDEPVSIGKLSFAWLPGPNLDCRGLEIGVPGSGRLQMQTDHLYLKLRFLPLLVGRLEFSEIALQRPKISLPAASPEGERKISLAQWLENTQIEQLQLTEAELIIPKRDNRPPTTLLMSLSLDNLRPLQSGTLSLTGELRKTGSTTSFRLAGDVSFEGTLANWQNWILDISGEVNNLRPGELLSLLQLRPPELFVDKIDRANVDLHGQPATGLSIELLTAGDNLVLSSSATKDLKLPPLEISARWTVKQAHQRLDSIALRLGSTFLTGSATLEPSGDGNRLGLQLHLDAKLADLSMLIPVSRFDSSVEQLRSAIRSGHLNVASALEIPLSKLADSSEWFRRLQLQADLSQGSVALGALGLVSNINLALSARNGTLNVTTGHFDWAESQFTVSGEVVAPQNDAGNLDLVFEGEPDAANLRNLLPNDMQDHIDINGVIPTRLRLSGPLGKITLGYQSNIKFLQGHFGSVYRKPSGLKGGIFATGSLSNQVLQIDNAGITLPPFNLTGSGRLELAGDMSIRAELGLDAIDLQLAQFRSPLLAGLHTRGQLTARCSLTGSHTTPLKLDGRVSFKEFGLRLTPVIGDLQKINGNLLFTELDLRSEVLDARLGESPVTIQGGIDSWQQPDISLHVRGQAVRAQDLIFHSEKMLLRDLDGKLNIDRQGIDFESVEVRLDGGTLAHVEGRMEGYRGPHVSLNISSEYGNIDEIISLWQTDKPRLRPAVKSDHAPTTTEISIKAARGKIGPLTFSNAEALLKTDGHGHLVILPLYFHHDAGYGVGHIFVDSSQPGPTRLAVSGHVENFDASAIYRDLLHRDGLVSGVTRGDFYLQGEPGRNFLPTSSGGISLQIDNGTLYRLPLISKVFSLLNVSQILSFNAPEMSSEGMPFNRITGAFAMRGGILSTDNLVIRSNSMDMSLILDQDLNNQTLKGVLGVKPLKTVDTIISSIPLVGWILAGENKAVLTAHFNVRGPVDNPVVTPAPATSIAEPIMGIFVRTLQLPGRMVTNISEALSAEPQSSDHQQQQQPATDPQNTVH